MKGPGRAIACAALLVCGALASDSAAAPSTAAGAHLSIDASPTLGAEAPIGDGWFEIVARIDNADGVPRRGTLVVSSGGSSSGSSRDRPFEARAPYQVPPHASSTVHVPVSVGRLFGSVDVIARGEDDAVLARTSVLPSTATAPMLVDVDAPSRLAVVLRGSTVTPGWTVGPGGFGGGAAPALPLAVGVPAVDGATGDPVLPERAACYSPATVVLMRSDRLARLGDDARTALVGWVLAGGTLAVVPVRPEDLRAGLLTTLAGGPIVSAPPPPIMMTLPPATRSTAPGLGAPGSSPPEESPEPSDPPDPGPELEPGDDAGPTPIGWFRPVRTTRTAPAAAGPSAAVRGQLTGFTGGNLRPSEYGATAAYGLGQVHVMGFDPTTAPALEDPWAQGRMLDMVTHGWERRAIVAFPQGAGSNRATNFADVERALDPNQNFRPALGVAAILLVLYSIVAGPLVFLRARARSRPLAPLRWAPAASAVCFATVVVLGLSGKGWRGRARRISLVEAGAGMSRGTAHRFRGLFASRARNMRVAGTAPDDVLETLASDPSERRPSALRVDRTGVALEDLRSAPWQTVVVGEDGFADLGAGVAVHARPDGSVTVANHTGHRLEHVVVWAPSTYASYFAAIDDGATVVSTAGRTMFHPAARTTLTAGHGTIHRLDASALQAAVGGAAGDDAAAPWTALGSGAGVTVDWWPDGVPVVMGEVAGGDGARADAGLRVESDRLIVRVVGEGGAT